MIVICNTCGKEQKVIGEDVNFDTRNHKCIDCGGRHILTTFSVKVD